MFKKLLAKRTMKKIAKSAAANRKTIETSVRRAVKDAKKSLHDLRLPVKVTISR